MRFGDIFFRDFVEVNGIYYMLDMRHTLDAYRAWRSGVLSPER